jgi:hypothetical protein
MGLLGLENSRAVLIGTARYDYLGQLPAVANNLRDLREVFVAPEVLGIPAEHCIVISDP